MQKYHSTNISALRKAMMIAALSCSFAATAPASANEGWQNVPLNQETFDVSKASSASFEKRDGRDALCINGEALLRGVSIANGSVAVDIANNHHRHFANLIFRAASQDDYETAYLRMHKSGQFDAVQYTPHLNGETNWQLFREAQARVDLGDAPWITLTVDFADERARIWVDSDSEQPALETDLTLPAKEGGIGLRTLFQGCFSNFRYTTLSPTWSAWKTEPPPSPPAGTIERWSLSHAFPMEDWAGVFEDLPSSPVWSTAETETNGRLLISRYRRKATSGDFERNQLDGVCAGVAIHSPNAQTAVFQFDASDMATVWLNGTALVAFDNSFRAKGPLHRGDFDATKQTVALPLREGRNELVVLVAERANGWGLGGSIQAGETLRIEPLEND